MFPTRLVIAPLEQHDTNKLINRNISKYCVGLNIISFVLQKYQMKCDKQVYFNMIFNPENRIRKSYVLYPFKNFNLCIIWTVNRQNNLAIMHHATRKSVIDRVCIEKVQDSTLLSVGNILFAPQLMTVMVYQTEINLTSFSIR